MDLSHFDITILSWTGLFVFGSYFFSGIIDATCGGGGLLNVPALMAIGMPPHMVVGTNQCSTILGSWTALIKYGKQGKVDFNVAWWGLPAALLGAFIGSKLNLIADEKFLQILMMVLIPLLVIFTLVKRDVGDENNSDRVSRNKKIIICMIIAFFVSGYHAFYGPASGTFYMVAFVMFLQYDAVSANGFARFYLAMINVLTSFVYGFSGLLCLKVVIIGSIANILGNYVGAILTINKGTRYVRPVFYCVLTALMVKLVMGFIG